MRMRTTGFVAAAISVGLVGAGKGAQGTGAVGLWTKADSVTHFDAFTYGPLAN